MLLNKTKLNLDHKARVVKQVYILVKPVLKRKILYFLKLKISYLKDSSYQFLGKLFIKLICLIKLTNFMGKIL